MCHSSGHSNLYGFFPAVRALIGVDWLCFQSLYILSLVRLYKIGFILTYLGIYTGDEDASDQDLFVVERKTFKSLCSGLVQQCGCLSNPSWTIASFIKV